MLINQGECIMSKMQNERRFCEVEQNQLELNQRVERKVIPCGKMPWLGTLPMPKFSGIAVCLHDTAKKWWNLITTPDDNKITFRQKFINRFWNENIRYQISKNLEFGWYNPRGKSTRVVYVIKMTTNARDLIQPMPKPEIINKQSRHFTEEIRSAIIMRGIKEFELLLELIELLDNNAPLNQSNRSHEYAGQNQGNYNPNGTRNNSHGYQDRFWGNNRGNYNPNGRPHKRFQPSQKNYRETET